MPLNILFGVWYVSCISNSGTYIAAKDIDDILINQQGIDAQSRDIAPFILLYVQDLFSNPI